MTTTPGELFATPGRCYRTDGQPIGRAEADVLKAAKRLARYIAAEVDPDDRNDDERALLAAFEALEPPAPALPPEPKRGAVRRDRNNDYWRRTPDGWKPMLTATGTKIGTSCRTWEELNRLGGPLVKLVPQAETFPRDLAGELVEALRKAQDQACGHFRYLPFVPLPGQRSTQLEETTFDHCENPEYGCAEARALLARATAALTDTTTTTEEASR